jgi:gamma-glutamylcyclotransferase (GGCT)/AIG2-like uncharacterized protein YtfP
MTPEKMMTTPTATHFVAANPRVHGAVQLDYLFVYGTLMRGGPLHKYLKVPNHLVTFVDTGFVKNALLYDCGDFPVLSLGVSEEQVVWGEIFSFVEGSPVLRGHLDFIENTHAGLYRRLKTLAHLEHAEMQVAAWVYVGAGQWWKQGTQVIPSGRWSDKRD